MSWVCEGTATDQPKLQRLEVETQCDRDDVLMAFPPSSFDWDGNVAEKCSVGSEDRGDGFSIGRRCFRVCHTPTQTALLWLYLSLVV